MEIQTVCMEPSRHQKYTVTKLGSDFLRYIKGDTYIGNRK